MFMKVNQKKLNIILFVIGVLVYYKVYWWIYSLIVFDVLTLDLRIINILDMIFLAVFVLSVVPCSYGLEYLLRKFLVK